MHTLLVLLCFTQLAKYITTPKKPVSGSWNKSRIQCEGNWGSATLPVAEGLH